MARSKRGVVRSVDMHQALNAAIRRNATSGSRGKGRVVRNLTHTPGHVDSGYLKAKAARGGIPGNSTDLLKMAHHGTTAKTPHGLGGMKPHQIKPPRIPGRRSGLKVVHVEGRAKIPTSMTAKRPGKGVINHLKAVK